MSLVDDIYELLERCDFPHLPCYLEAEKLIKSANNLCGYSCDGLMWWAGYHSPEGDSIQLDFATVPGIKEMIMTPGEYRSVLSWPFERGYKRVLACTTNTKAVKALLRCGFYRDYNVNGKYILTYEAYKRKFSRRGKPIHS